MQGWTLVPTSFNRGRAILFNLKIRLAIVSICVCLSWEPSAAIAQLKARSYKGWSKATPASRSAASKSAARPANAVGPASAVQTAYYQAGGAPDSLQYPAGGLPDPANYSGSAQQNSSIGSGPAQLPTFPPNDLPPSGAPERSRSLSDATFPPTLPENNAPQNFSLNDDPSSLSNSVPPNLGQPSGQENTISQGSLPQGGMSRGSTSRAQTPAQPNLRQVPSRNNAVTTANAQVLPPSENTPSVEVNRQPYYPATQGSNQLRSQSTSGAGRGLANGLRDSSAQGGNGLRNASTTTNTSQPRRPGTQIATGLPYVTAPRSRYPTTYYNPAVFQMAAYQRAQAAQTQLPPTNAQQAPNAGLVAQRQQPYAPQFIPTSYVACDTPVPSFPSTGAVPGTYLPPTYAANVNPGLYSPNNSGYAPLFSLGQENYNVQLGRGLVGQPTVYVTGQPIRNFMRYIFP